METKAALTFNDFPKVPCTYIDVCVACSTQLDDDTISYNNGICPACGYDSEATVCDTNLVIFKVVPSEIIPWWKFWKHPESYSYYARNDFSFKWLTHNKRTEDLLFQPPAWSHRFLYSTVKNLNRSHSVQWHWLAAFVRIVTLLNFTKINRLQRAQFESVKTHHNSYWYRYRGCDWLFTD